jgi:hypothetical protein
LYEVANESNLATVSKKGAFRGRGAA